MGWFCIVCQHFNETLGGSCEECVSSGSLVVGCMAATPKVEQSRLVGSSSGPAMTTLGAALTFIPVTKDTVKCPYKSTGLQKLVGMCTLYYGKPIDVPGTMYADVCPCQQHVNPDIIDGKVTEFSTKKGLSPSVPVFRNATTGKVTILGDGHHTFCASLKSATPIILWLFEAKAYGSLGHQDWRSCTKKKFATQAAAKTGSKYA